MSCCFNCWVYCLLSWFSGSFRGASGRRKGVVYPLQGQTPQAGLPCPALSTAGKLPACARWMCVHMDPWLRSRLASLQDSSGLSTTQSRVFFKFCKQLLYLQLMSSLISSSAYQLFISVLLAKYCIISPHLEEIFQRWHFLLELFKRSTGLELRVIFYIWMLNKIASLLKIT